uniref:protein-tyrosine-phosphatase n=1 Tax=Littorina littorea TaxID=31216 RepID=A0A0A7RPS7_LITLI|nr:fucolectin-related molecule [Littorina littorea]
MKGIVCLDVIVFSLLCFLAVERVAQGVTTCPDGRWGDSCEYRCHCASGQCDRDSGACSDQCDVGWHDGQGQTCQQRNVALGKVANLSSASPSQTPDPSFKVVDGNRSNQGDAANDTCVYTPSGLLRVEWTVDLEEDYSISSILLVFRDTDFSRIRGFSVSVFTDGGTWIQCYQQQGSTSQLQFRVDCALTGRQVRVANSRNDPVPSGFSQNAFLDLCEVEVYECANGTFGENCSRQCHCMSGHCNVTSGRCLDTGQCRDGWTSASCDQVCISGTYGPECNLTCGHCHSNQKCHPVTGACPSQCAAGYRDAQNGCREACIAGRFGVDCGQTCGQCKNKDTCHSATGVCPNGCKEGYHGNACLPVVPESKDDSDEGLPTTAVVGAVAAGGTIFLCCVCAVAQIRKTRRKKRNSKYKSESNGRDSPTLTNPIAAAVAASSAKAAKDGGRKSSIFSGRKMSLFGDRKNSVVFAGGAERKKSIFAAVFGFAKDEDLSGLPVYHNSTFVNGDASQGLFNQDKNAGVPVEMFRQYVYGKRRGASSLENEFKALPTGYTATYEDAERPENRDKNKFEGYYPYDYNRVVLKAWGHGDYVNASHIKDYRGKDLYIAAQAPCKKSASDFWHMVWQENIGRIVMLTSFVENGKSKCDRYWSENGCVTYGDITVKDAAQTVRATYTIRSMKLIQKKTCETREVIHYQYTEWVENAIPLVHDLLEFIWRVKATVTDLRGPLLVHCSNGVGRTGTFIAVDSLLLQAEDTGKVDVKNYIELLRHQRKNMVLTKEQYAFVHAALIDGIILGDTRILATQFYEGFEREGDQLRIGYRQISEQYQELSYLKSAMAFRRDSGIENVSDLRSMNCDGMTMQFVPSTLSSNMFRLVDADEDTDVQKFMLLLRNINAMTVVCLHPQDFQVFTRCLEWSRKLEEKIAEKKKAKEEAEKDEDEDEDEEEDEDEDLYKMEALTTTELSPELTANEYRVFVDDYDEVTLELMNLHGWEQGNKLFPQTLNTVIMNMADRIHTRQMQLGFHPVVILIGEMQESAGLFCVLTNIVHGIQLDDEVEVYSNVCRVRRLMPEIVDNAEEFLFCHEFAAKFANFQKVDFHF